MARADKVHDIIDKEGEGLLVIALPNSSQAIVRAISRKTGESMANVFSGALMFLAGKVLNKEEQDDLKKELIKLIDDD